MKFISQPDTITIFQPYGIDDGRRLVGATVQQLEDATPPPDESRNHQTAMMRDLDQAFRSAYTTAASLPIVPEALDCAVEEAASTTIHTYLGEDACIETEVVPTFYRYVVTFFRSFIEFGVDPVAGVSLADQSRGGD